MDFLGFVIGLFVGVPLGCAFFALVAAGATEEREEIARRDGEATGYRKAVTDFGHLGP